jgi:hypothetical protein
LWFKIIGPIEQIETIVAGRSIRELARLRKVHGGTRWRKLKGVAKVELPEGSTVRAEVHWYEAHGVGRCELKMKRILK